MFTCPSDHDQDTMGHTRAISCEAADLSRIKPSRRAESPPPPPYDPPPPYHLALAREQRQHHAHGQPVCNGVETILSY